MLKLLNFQNLKLLVSSKWWKLTKVAIFLLCAGLVTISIIQIINFFENQQNLRLDQNILSDNKLWVMPAGNYASQRFSKLNQINAENVNQLKVAWTFSTGSLRAHQGSPLVVNDIMYIHTPFPNEIYALDLNDEKKILWKYKPKIDIKVLGGVCCSAGNRGLTYLDGKIIFHQIDTTLVALDAKSGEVIWSVVTGESEVITDTNTTTILAAKNKIIVGISGGEYGIWGYISAYNINTGKLEWRAYSTGHDKDMLVDPEKTTVLGKLIGKDSSLNSWDGDQWKTGGGATWGWFSYDEEENLVYYGTGNPAPWNPIQRPGDNKWTNAIFARDLDTGIAKWVYQITPHDQWDFDGINEMILTERTINGIEKKLLTHFDRSGFVYTLDRVSGNLIDAKKFHPSVNWATKVELDKSSKNFGRPVLDYSKSPEHNGENTVVENTCPSQLGLKNRQPASYSPELNIFFVPTIHLCMDYEIFNVKYTAGHPFLGAGYILRRVPNSHRGGGNFIAWDGNNQEMIWSIPETFPVWSGPLATSGGIVFYGTFEGYFKAVDSATGELLYKFKTPTGIVGNVMSYMHNGKQYVAVLSGFGGMSFGLVSGLLRSDDDDTTEPAYTSLDQFPRGGQLTVFSLPDEVQN